MSDDENGKGPFDLDLEKLKLPKDFSSGVTMERVHSTVEVRKPDRQWFVRVHPDDKVMHLDTKVLILKDERETYLVAPPLWAELSPELVAVRIVTAVNRGGKEFLWCLRLPDGNGRSNPWFESALAAATVAMTDWVRVAADAGEYRIEKARSPGALPEPEWSGRSLKELLSLGFKDKYIISASHAVVKKLRGEQ